MQTCLSVTGALVCVARLPCQITSTLTSRKERIMRKLVLLCASLCAMAFVVPTTPAHAQIRYWVASNGADSNSCSETSPCATFAGAIAKGGAGEIDCLNSGDYGALNSTTVSISGSITIDCGTGNIGEMELNGGTAVININTSSAATIVLRHLNLNGYDTVGTSGINTQNFPSGTLIIEDCTIHGFYVHHVGLTFTNGNGISFTPSSGRGLLQVAHTLIFDNSVGIVVSPSGGQIASVTLNQVELTGNLADGFDMGGAGVVAGTIRKSVVGENGSNGVFAGSNQVYFTIKDSSIVDNLTYGILSGSAGVNLGVSTTTISGNGTGVGIAAGSVFSFGNNDLSANATNGSFSSTTPLQ